MDWRRIFQRKPSPPRGTNVRDDYLDSLRREKTRIDNEYEKKRLKAEIAEEYKKRTRDNVYGFKEEKKTAFQAIDSNEKLEMDNTEYKPQINKPKIDVKRFNKFAAKFRRKTVTIKNRIKKVNLRNTESDKKYQKYYSIGKVKINPPSSPRTMKFQYVNRQPVRQAAPMQNILAAPNTFVGERKNILQDDNNILKAKNPIFSKTRI